jgi:hypothetical protein
MTWGRERIRKKTPLERTRQVELFEEITCDWFMKMERASKTKVMGRACQSERAGNGR